MFFKRLLIKLAKKDTINSLLDIYESIDQIPDWRLKYLSLTREDLNVYSAGEFERLQELQRIKHYSDTGIKETDPEQRERLAKMDRLKKWK